MYVEYNGKTVDHYNCDYFKFRGKGDEMKDEYSVCVTPLYFVDLDCTVKINIKTSIRGVSKHEITCTENKFTKNMYCGPQDRTVFIEFINRYARPTNEAKFKLKITAKKEYDHDKYRARLFWTIVGSLMGGSALLAVCVFLCFRYVCGWKPSLGKGSHPTQGYSATANPNVAYIDQTQQSTMATPSNISSPGVYPMASYPPPQRDASLWTDDNKLLGPRPSYVALTKYSTSHVNTQIKRSIRV